MSDFYEMAAIARQIIRTEGHGIDRNLGSDLGRCHGDLVTDRRKHYGDKVKDYGLTRDPEHHLRAKHGMKRQAEIHRLPIPRHRALVVV